MQCGQTWARICLPTLTQRRQPASGYTSEAQTHPLPDLAPYHDHNQGRRKEEVKLPRFSSSPLWRSCGGFPLPSLVSSLTRRRSHSVSRFGEEGRRLGDFPFCFSSLSPFFLSLLTAVTGISTSRSAAFFQKKLFSLSLYAQKRASEEKGENSLLLKAGDFSRKRELRKRRNLRREQFSEISPYFEKKKRMKCKYESFCSFLP